MKKIKFNSTKQFALSFLFIDFLFWLFVAGTCVFKTEDCADAGAFGPYFFFQPWSEIIGGFFPPITSYAAYMTLIVVVFSLMHGILGAILGFLLRKNKVGWPVSIVISGAIIFITAFFFTYKTTLREAEETTGTYLWEVTDANDFEITYRDAEWYEGDEALTQCKFHGDCSDDQTDTPGGFYLYADKSSSGTYNATLLKNAKIILLNPQEPGSQSNPISYKEYVEARKTCQTDIENCAYYGIGGEFELFRVTMNDVDGITRMEEVYLP